MPPFNLSNVNLAWEGHAERLQAVDVFNVLTGPELLQRTEALMPEHRE